MVTVLPIALAGYDHYSTLIFGVLFLMVVMFMPNGIAGALENLAGRFLNNRRSTSGQRSDG